MSQMIIGSGGGGFMIIYIIALMALLYFLMIRPQKKHQDKHKQMLNNLKINDRILTVGGITGYVRELTDDYIYVEIADGLVVEFNRQYVATVLQDEAAEEDDEDVPAEDAEEIETVAQIEAAEDAEEAKEEAAAEETATEEKK